MKKLYQKKAAPTREMVGARREEE